MLVAGTLFMEFLDGTIVATAAPDIALSLHVRAPDVGVAVTAYLLAMAVLIPLSGRLADRFGTRTVFLAAIVVFTSASGLCALATSLPVLTAARAMQGAGGAMMVPVGRLVVLRGTAKPDLIRAIALLTWPALVAPVLAPLAGGLLTTYLSWQWIFLVNLPLGAVAAVAALRLVPQLRTDARPPMDWWGFVLTGVAIAALVLAATELGAAHPNAGRVAVAVAVSLVAGVAAVRHLRRADHPLVDLAVLRIPTFRLSHSSGSVFRAGVTAVPFVLPLMFQEAFGWSAVRAGAVVSTIFVGNLFIKPATTPLLRRVSFRAVISGSVMVVSATMAGCAALGAQTPLPLVVALLVVSGAARSVGFTGYATIAFADVEAPAMTHASTLSATLYPLAGAFGVAVGALGIQLGTSLDGGGPAWAYRLTFLLLAVLTLSTLAGALRMPSDAGHRLQVGR